VTSLAVWQLALGVFLGTLPLLGVIIWNLIEVRSIRAEILTINHILADIRERLATLEERDRWTHPGLMTK
jgi:hypothetical protein